MTVDLSQRIAEITLNSTSPSPRGKAINHAVLTHAKEEGIPVRTIPVPTQEPEAL